MGRVAGWQQFELSSAHQQNIFFSMLSANLNDLDYSWCRPGYRPYRKPRHLLMENDFGKKGSWPPRAATVPSQNFKHTNVFNFIDDTLKFSESSQRSYLPGNGNNWRELFFSHNSSETFQSQRVCREISGLNSSGTHYYYHYHYQHLYQYRTSTQTYDTLQSICSIDNCLTLLVKSSAEQTLTEFHLQKRSLS